MFATQVTVVGMITDCPQHLMGPGAEGESSSSVSLSVVPRNCWAGRHYRDGDVAGDYVADVVTPTSAI